MPWVEEIVLMRLQLEKHRGTMHELAGYLKIYRAIREKMIKSKSGIVFWIDSSWEDPNRLQDMLSFFGYNNDYSEGH